MALRAPHLGRHEHLLAGGYDSAPRRLGYGLPNGLLGEVQRGGVEVVVAELQGGEHGAPDFLRHERERRRAEPHRRHRPPAGARQELWDFGGAVAAPW